MLGSTPSEHRRFSPRHDMSTTLATPSAILFVLGLALIYFAIRGWDSKYKVLGGRLTDGKAI